MSRATIVLNSRSRREQAASWAMKLPSGTRVEFKEAKRSLPQNDRMWAMLTDIAVQLPWHGIKLSPDDWKLLFLDALKRELRMVPNIDGNGFVNLGRSSSDLSKAEMSELIELIAAFGANHNVIFHDPNPSQIHTAPSGPAETLEPAANLAPQHAAGSLIQETV